MKKRIEHKSYVANGAQAIIYKCSTSDPQYSDATVPNVAGES